MKQSQNKFMFVKYSVDLNLNNKCLQLLNWLTLSWIKLPSYFTKNITCHKLNEHFLVIWNEKETRNKWNCRRTKFNCIIMKTVAWHLLFSLTRTFFNSFFSSSSCIPGEMNSRKFIRCFLVLNAAALSLLVITNVDH